MEKFSVRQLVFGTAAGPIGLVIRTLELPNPSNRSPAFDRSPALHFRCQRLHTLHAMQGLSGGSAEAPLLRRHRRASAYYTTRPRHPESTPSAHHRLFPHLVWLLSDEGLSGICLQIGFDR